MLALHDYATDLAGSKDYRLLAKLNEIYRSFYPEGLVIDLERDDSEAFQRSGCDLRVNLRTPRHGPPLIHTIEEKIRSQAHSSYSDLLIETVSNKERQTAGWIYTSVAHWLSYVRHPAGIVDVWLLPMGDLKRWFASRHDNYPIREARTSVGAGFYTTVNRAVPLDDLDFRRFCAAHGAKHVRVSDVINWDDYDLPF